MKPDLTSRDNPKIKQIRALRQRKQREAADLFLVEGIRHVGEAAAASEAGGNHPTLEYICYAPELLTSSFAQELIRQETEKGIPCFSLPADLFASLAEKENPQGIIAVVRQARQDLADLSPENFPWAVALVAPQDPGNIGAILRTLDAVGASGLILVDSSVDPYHPSSVRASMGAIFWRPVVQAAFAEFKLWTRQSSYSIYGTSAHGTTDYLAVSEYRLPLVLLMGSEREGLSQQQAEACDLLLRLPMRGQVSSLNLAVATGIMLYSILARLSQ